MSGGYAKKDAECVNQAVKIVQELTSFINKLVAIGAGGSVLDPYYSLLDAFVTVSNWNVACQIPTQANSLKSRLSTQAGLSDVLYTLVNVPIEGLFQESNADLNNKLWEAGYAMW